MSQKITVGQIDSLTATAAEINILDGVTSTAAEINLLDGSTAGTVVNSKAVIYGASGEVNATTLQVGGVSITSTPAELNILDGVTATAAELNILDGVTATTAELNYTDGVTSNIQTQLNAKSPTASPTFTGTPAAPTASAGTNTTQIATTAFVSTAVSNLVDSAPGTLDTLNELAAALGDDANFSTTVTNSIATKLPLAGGTMSGNIVMSGAQTVDGRDLSVDGTKLDGIESGATADQTASEILTAIKTVDGAGSGLDADLLDGVSSASFLRSDTADTMTANLNIGNGSYNFGIGTENAQANSTVGRTATYNEGIFWHSDNSSYAIYRTAGTWASPNYQQLKLDWPTGIILNGGTAYGLSGVKVEGDLTVTGVMNGTATIARYADLAERYTTDADYEPGTVVVFGGEAEVTQSTQRLNRRVAGIVSTDPAYLMNSELENSVAVGLQGRVPCKVVGEIRKGDMMVTSSTPGHAEAWHEEGDPPMGTVIGKALENKTDSVEGVIEVVVGRM